MNSLISVLLLLTVISFSSIAQHDTIPMSSLGGKYCGELNKDGIPHGQGELIATFGGGGYVGEWKNGVYHGQGKKTWHTGDVYEGEWKLGKRHGQGKMTWKNGMTHEGTWKNNNEHGEGVIVYPHGNSRSGKWVHGLMHGKGSYKVQDDGESYDDNYYHGYNLRSTDSIR